MDLIVSDITMDEHYFPGAQGISKKENGIRVGIVRRITETVEGEIAYSVELQVNGKQVPVVCTVMSRFGGVYNFEEFNVRPWDKQELDAHLPVSAGELAYRAGDVVVVGLLGGSFYDGIILGGLKHPAREQKIVDDSIQYYSIFNGLEKQIRADGSYKVTFKGAPVNEKLLEAPPTGTAPVSPAYNPLIAESYYGFDANGSFIVTDSAPAGPQMIKVFKDQSSGSIILKSGQSTVELGGNPAIGQFGAKAANITLESQQALNMSSLLKTNIQGTQVSIKGLQVAIGNDTIELVDALITLITELGNVVVTSPVGTCTPIATSPNWASAVIPLMVKLTTLKSSPQDADPFELKGDDSEDIGEDI